MTAELHIHWEGDAPGLAEHRLSIGAFGEPLNHLLKAVRRIASGIVTDAWGDAEHGAKGGQYAKAARLIDIEVASLSKGSLNVSAVCRTGVPLGANMPLFDQLPPMALDRLVVDLEHESRGEPRNALVRKYLGSLPREVTFQRYAYVENGKVIREAKFGQPKLVELPTSLPFLREVSGVVVGVGFNPGKNEVRLKDDEGASLSCSATEAQVEKALKLRSERVKAMVLSEGNRLLWIRPESAARGPRSDEEMSQYLHERWGEVLRRLSR